MAEKKVHHETSFESRTESNPWFFVAILVTVLLVASFASNLYLISKMGNTGTVPSQAAVPTPTQAAPSAIPTPTAAPGVVAVSADDDPVMGSADAKVTIIEFSDFQCPFCGRFHTDAFKQIKTEYIDTGKVNFVYRDYPLGFHPEAQKSAEASECADEQGKYWEYCELLFANQGTLSNANYKLWAGQLGMNQAQFDSCLDTGKYASEVQADFAAGQAAGVSGTPTFFVNGVKLVGAQPFAAFKPVIDAELAKVN